MRRPEWLFLFVGLFIGVMYSFISIGTPVLPSPLGTAVTLVVLSVIGVASIALILDRSPWPGVLGLTVIVRLPYVTMRAIHDDSPFFLSNAQRVYNSVLSESFSMAQLPIRYLSVNVVMGGFVALYGPAGANIASLTAAIATIPVLGAAGASLYHSKKVGVMTGILAAVFPIHMYYSSWVYSEPIALFFFSVGLYAIIASRWGLATAGMVPLLFMRAEYTLLILIPLIGLLVVRQSRMYYPAIGMPLVGFWALLLIPGLADQFVEFVNSLPFNLLRAGFLTFIGFTANPVSHASMNLSYYLPHLLHWGIPYWEVTLVNPLLGGFLVVGLLVTFPQVRSVGIAIAGLIPILVIGFFIREVLGASSAYGLALLLIIPASGVLLVLAGTRMNRQLQPLYATAPYLWFLSIVFLGPRYILPVAFILLLYAGRGLCWLHDRLVHQSEFKISLPSVLVR